MGPFPDNEMVETVDEDMPTRWFARAEAGSHTQLRVVTCLRRFCVGDKFFLKNNMILCQLDYEGHLTGSERPPQ